MLTFELEFGVAVVTEPEHFKQTAPHASCPAAHYLSRHTTACPSPAPEQQRSPTRTMQSYLKYARDIARMHHALAQGLMQPTLSLHGSGITSSSRGA